MEIRRSKIWLVISYAWLFPTAVMFVSIFIMTPPNVFTVLPVLGAVFGLFDFWICRKMYTERIFISGDKISIYYRWWRGREEFKLSEIERVKYTRLSMVFILKYDKKTLDLMSLSKNDEIYIYEFLRNKGILIEYTGGTNNEIRH